MSDNNFDLLRRLAGVTKVREFCTIDIEATDWVNPYAVGFYDGKTYVDFFGATCIKDALAFVLQPEYAGKWIYAHNGGNYDFIFFLQSLLSSRFEHEYRTEITPIGSCMFRLDVTEIIDEEKKKAQKHVARKWTFLDSARLLPIKLDDLGETFGLGRKVELSMSYNDLGKVENRKVAAHYLEQDCKLLYKSIAKFQHVINKLGGQIGPTLPATSLDLFRRKYLKTDVHTNRHFLGCPDYGKDPKKTECKGCGHNFIRAAYAGGRSEIFRTSFTPSPGHEEAYLYDVNAMYAAMMLEAMPVGEGIVPDQELTEADVYANALHRTGIVDCDVMIPGDCYLPPLPVKRKGKLIFPAGKFRGTWDTAELTLLKEVGGKILKVHRSIWFDEAPIFGNFVNTLYQFRDKSRTDWNAGMDWIVKVLLNAAYGKFAMREERSRYVVHPEKIENMVPLDLEADIWSEDVFVSPNYIVPQLAVHITALARRALWRILNGIVKRGGRIYYCDTDSVICSGVKLDADKKLGGLKLENTITRATFTLPKLYLIETKEESTKKKRERNIKVRAKGMGPGIRLGEKGDDPFAGELSESEYFRITSDGEGDRALHRHRLTKFKEGLAAYLKEATKFPRVIPSDKEIRTRYDKRRILDGGDTAPMVTL